MTESSFPKIDGDILYASGVNSFARPVQIIYTGSGFDSSTDSVSTGSVILNTIPAGSINSSKYIELKVDYKIQHNATIQNKQTKVSLI